MSLVEKSVEGGYFVVPAYTPTSSEATNGRYMVSAIVYTIIRMLCVVCALFTLLFYQIEP